METARKKFMATRDFFEVILSFGWRMAQYWFYTVPMFFFMLFWRPWSAFLMLALSVFPQSKAVVKFTPPTKQMMSFVTAPFRRMMPSQFQGIHVIPNDKPILFIGYDTAFHFEIPLLQQKLYESKGMFFRTIIPQKWSTELAINNDKSKDGLKMAGKLLLSRLLHFFGAVEPELNERLIENKENIYLCASSLDQSSMLLLEKTISKALEYSYVIIPVASVGTDDVITIPYRIRIGRLFSFIPYQLFWINRKTTIPIPNFKRQTNFVKFGRLRDKNSLSSNEKKEIKTLAHEIYEEIGSLTASLLTTQSNSFEEDHYSQQKNSLQSMMKNSFEQVKKGVNHISEKMKKNKEEEKGDLLLKKRSHIASKEKEMNHSEKQSQSQSQSQSQLQHQSQAQVRVDVQPQVQQSERSEQFERSERSERFEQSERKLPQPQLQYQYQPLPQPQPTVISNIILEQTPLERNLQWEQNVHDEDYERDEHDDEGESGEQQQQDQSEQQQQQQQKSKKQPKQQSNQENEPNENAFVVQESRAKKRHRRKMQQQQQQEHLQSKRSSDSPSLMRSHQLDEISFENRVDSTPR